MREGNVVVSGSRISFIEGGEGTPVLFLHGNTGSGRWFARVMDIAGFRCVAPDLPNFGRSDSIELSDIDRYADYALGLLDELKIERPIVAGHSLGGSVAMSMAVRRPERVAKLLLVDSAPVGGLKTPEAHYPIIERYRTDRTLLKQALRAIAPHLTDETFFEQLVDDATKMNGASFSGNARALERADYTALADRFRGPVLFVVGAEDVLITEQMARESAGAFPRGRARVLPGVGHSVVVENPALFASILTEFALEKND